MSGPAENVCEPHHFVWTWPINDDAHGSIGVCDLCGAVTTAERDARMLAEREAEVLRETANAWTQGAWSDVMLPKPTPPAVPVIAYSNRVGDWLRDRATRPLDAATEETDR